MTYVLPSVSTSSIIFCTSASEGLNPVALNNGAKSRVSTEPSPSLSNRENISCTSEMNESLDARWHNDDANNNDLAPVF